VPKNSRFPISRQLDARLRGAFKPTAAPQWLKQRENLARPVAKLGQAKPSPQKKPKQKRKGGGRKPSFTPEEQTRLQGIYRDLLDRNPKLKSYSLAEKAMRQFLPEDKRNVSPRTLQRHVLRPVRGKRTK
jgi:hypothetical protein